MDHSLTELDEEALAHRVLERVKADLAALPKEHILSINLDVPATVATVLGVLPEVQTLREQIAGELPSFDIARFDRLEDYALALSYADARYLGAMQSPDDVELLATQASKLRQKLLTEAKAFVYAGVLREDQLADLQRANGEKSTATDLLLLTDVLLREWPQIEGKTVMTVASLEEASRVARQLLRAVEAREQGPARVAQAIELRLRAYTALLRAYDDARRAVTYLRSELGDADMIMPSLYPARLRRRTTDPALQAGAPAAAAAPRRT
jgi:hypothetical protein